MTYQINYNIPIPKTGRGAPPKYDFPKLKIGQSIDVKTIREVNAFRGFCKTRGHKALSRRLTNLDGDTIYRLWRTE